MPHRKDMCAHPAGFSLEGGASPGNEEEEEAEERCEMRLWPHTGLVGDKCFVAAQRERSQGFRI